MTIELTKRALTVVAATLLPAGMAQALEIDPHVPPQVNIGGQLISTLDIDQRDGSDGTRGRETLNVSDSTLLFGFAKYLHDDAYYAWADFGFKVPDDQTDLRDDIFMHQLYAGIGGRDFELRMGRTNLQNSLVRFPTIRGEDLMAFTHVRNTFVEDGHADAWEMYGHQLAGSLYRGPWRADIAAVARAEVEDADKAPGYSNFNSGQLGLSWQVSEGQRPAGRLRHVGVAMDSQQIGEDGDEWAHALLGGFNLQLNGNPEGPWNLDGQAIHQAGVERDAVASRQDLAAAEHTSLVTALRYRHKPYLQPRWQAALAVAWQDYADIDDGQSVAIAPSLSWRLGKGVEAMAQYRYMDHGEGLEDALHYQDRHSVQIGLVFDFDYTINKSVGQRDSVLFLEHGMSDYGPVRGGH